MFKIRLEVSKGSVSYNVQEKGTCDPLKKSHGWDPPITLRTSAHLFSDKRGYNQNGTAHSVLRDNVYSFGN